MVRVERACDVYVPFVSAILALAEARSVFDVATGFEINESSTACAPRQPPARSPKPLVTPMPRTLRNLPTRAPHSQPPAAIASPSALSLVPSRPWPPALAPPL